MVTETTRFVPADVIDDLSRIEYPAGVDEKFDGVRLLALIDSDGDVILQSKAGQPYDLPTIKGAVEALDLRNSILDGEFVAGSFEETLSVIQGGIPDTCGRYMIFDLVSRGECPETLNVRRIALVALASHRFEEDGPLNLVDVKAVKDKSEMRAFFRSVTKAGGEGIVIKKLDSRYREPYAWVRLKTARTFDGVVVGTIEGKGKFGLSLGAFVVEIDGVKSKVTNGLSIAERVRLWNAREELIGRWVAVGAQGLTAAGRLRGQKTVRLREAKA